MFTIIRWVWVTVKLLIDLVPFIMAAFFVVAATGTPDRHEELLLIILASVWALGGVIEMEVCRVKRKLDALGNTTVKFEEVTDEQ